MNSFARYLFQGLFSWVYGAIIQLSEPALIDSWLAIHWLQVLIIILLFGTLIDILVWLLRWRPDLVWRSGAHHVSRLLDPEEQQMRRFRKGYREENADIGAIAQPLMDAPVPDDVILYTHQTDQHPAFEDAYIDLQFAKQNAETPARHRRGDRYRKVNAKTHQTQRRFTLSEEADAPVNGLPPVVNKDQAFRAPVFPRQNKPDGHA